MNMTVTTNDEKADKEDGMPETILDDWGKEAKEEVGGFGPALKAHGDFSGLAGVLGGMVRDVLSRVLQTVWDEVLADEAFRATREHVGASLGVTFKGAREVRV